MKPVTEVGERSFEVEVAMALGSVQAALVDIVDRNPDLAEVVQARLVRTIWKIEPLTNVANLKRMRAAYARSERTSALVDQVLAGVVDVEQPPAQAGVSG